MGNNFGPKPPAKINLPAGTQPQVPKGKIPTKREIKETKRVEREKKKFPKQASVAKGFGRITSLINSTIYKIREKVNDAYYGKKPVNSQSKQANPLDYGLINVLNLLLEVDVCAIFNYGLNKLPGTPPFDPRDKEKASQTTLGSIKWQVQNYAYQINNTIDEYYTQYADASSQNIRIGLYSLIQNVNNSLSSARELLYSEPLLASFPELNPINNFLDNVQKYFSKYTNINDIDDQNIKNILDFVQKTKTTCSAILSLNNPTAALQFADSVFGTNLMDQIKKLDKVLNPKNIPRAIKNVTRAGNQIKDVTDKILQYINYGRFIISIAMLLIFILKILNKFLKLLPIPNLFTILGLSTLMSEANGKIVDTVDYFMKRLSEINSVFNAMYNLCQDLSSKIQSLLDAVKQLLQNILECQDSDLPPLSDSVKDLNVLAKQLESIKDQLDEFITTYDNNKKNKNTNFGDYSIEILTEELTDEGISRKRRYGVALDTNRVIVAQSTPTFASDDNVIIQEVKLLLISKNLVKNVAASASTIDELNIMEESLNYLPDTDLSLDALEESVVFTPSYDTPDNEDEDEDDENGDDSLNLNAFVNKLKGGKKLRRRMRQKLAAQKLELANNLQNTDKGAKYTSKTVKKKKEDAYKDNIKVQEEIIEVHKNRIKKFKLLIAANPTSSVVYLKLIKDRKEKIKQCEKKIRDYKQQLASLK